MLDQEGKDGVEIDFTKKRRRDNGAIQISPLGVDDAKLKDKHRGTSEYRRSVIRIQKKEDDPSRKKKKKKKSVLQKKMLLKRSKTIKGVDHNNNQNDDEFDENLRVED